VRVHAADWAPNGAHPDGHRILLVHGLGANTITWEPIAQPLADRLGATVTAIDLIGFGRTRAPGRPATVAANRRIVTAILESHGPSVVIGNSMGGAIAVGVTARRPDLVTSLVLIDPALPNARPGLVDMLRLARFAPVMLSPVGRHFIRSRARLLGPQRLVDTSLEWSVHDMSRLDPVLVRRLVALAAERYAYPEAPAAYAEAARSLLLYLARGLHDDLAIAAPLRPTLLVHGEHDRLVNVDAARDAAARHASVDLEVLDGVGHAPQLEVPDRLVAVLASWLDARMSGWQSQHRAPVSSTIRSEPSSTS
jgi:pimeloyl-ACP methyl ester carboxylesterase